MTSNSKRCIIRVTKEIEKKGNNKMIDLQITFFHNENKYKPISTIVTIKQEDKAINLLDNKETKKDIIHKGIVKICQKRYWNNKDLVRYNYLKAKARKVETEE